MTEWPQPSIDFRRAKKRSKTPMKATSSFNKTLLTLTLTAGMAATVLADNNINQQDFSTVIDNPFFPLVPNTTYVYVVTTDGSVARHEFAATPRTTTTVGV